MLFFKSYLRFFSLGFHLLHLFLSHHLQKNFQLALKVHQNLSQEQDLLLLSQLFFQLLLLGFHYPNQVLQLLLHLYFNNPFYKLFLLLLLLSQLFFLYQYFFLLP